MTRRGFTSKEILLGIFMLVIVAVVLIPVSMSMRSKDSLDVDVRRMQKLYMTLSIYESDSNGEMPTTLQKARYLISEPTILQSTKDPWVDTANSYPVDGGIPDFDPKGSPTRISFSYFYAYSAAKKEVTIPWPEMKYRAISGFIANEWQGGVKKGSNFQAEVSGRVVRLNTDGALFVFERDHPDALGDYLTLFGNAWAKLNR